MNKLTAEQIIEKAKELYGNDIADFAYDPSEEVAGHVVEVDSTGGEDEGSHWTRTYHFTEHDVYLKVTGFYQSHHGTDFDDGWDCVKEVKPKEKVVTIYE